MGQKEQYSASYAFLEALQQAGINYVFANLGSDHPALMEAIASGGRGTFPQIITCPHEMVAMSMADGFARLTGRPQCVLVHVDVGTQMLGCAMHNASVARCPILVFAGLSPFTLEGEMRGSRTEYIHWLQDAPDQKQIVAQYCRYTAEIKTGRNIKQMVTRALQFAKSSPKGPSYLVGAREVMEEHITPYDLDLGLWTAVDPAALPPSAVGEIVALLASAQNPLIITGYSGRNTATVPQLVTLAESIPGVRVLDALGSDMCFPYTHRSSLGVRIGHDQSIIDADVILVLDCDVPWIPTQCRPREDCKVVHIDVDPLKPGMAVHYLPAFRRYRADCETALRQLNAYIASTEEYSRLPGTEPYASRWIQLAKSRHVSLADIANRAAPPRDKADPPSTSHLCSKLREACPEDTIWCVEAVTNATAVYDQLQVDTPGHLVNGGGGGLGWSGGGTLGVKLASDWEAGGTGRGKFVCGIVGDGTFLFGVPGSAYWIAMRYKIPTLTVVLSNKGWNAPRNSVTLVHPDGCAARQSNEELNISFAPVPDYSGIAKAAAGGNAWARIVRNVHDLEEALPEAVRQVQRGVSAILEVRLSRAVLD